MIGKIWILLPLGLTDVCTSPLSTLMLRFTVLYDARGAARYARATGLWLFSIRPY